MMSLFFIFTIGLLPLGLWGTYFYLKNPRKEPGKVVFKILLLGTLSLVPVLLFHQWLLRSVVKSLELAWPLLSTPFFKALVELTLLVLFILVFVSLFAFLNALFIAFQKKQNLPSPPKGSIYKKLYNLSPILLVFVGLLLIDGGSHLILSESFVLSMSGSIIVFAVLEEYFKYMINPFLVQEKIHSVGTAMVHALYVGLAFAFIENLLFFYVNINSPNFETIVLYRSIFTTLLHIGASGILGYFYGLSLFSNSMVANYEIERGKYKLPFWLSLFIRKKETAFQSISVTQGFFLAAALHAIFNLLINFGFKGTASAFVIVMTTGVLMMLRSQAAQVQYGLIGTTLMPEIDFEQLRLKIAVLKEVKLIQAQKNQAISRPIPLN